MSYNRYQIFDFPPNWTSGISLRYSFNTSVYTTEHYKEQRKPLRLRPRFEMQYTILSDVAPRAIDFLRAALNSVMYVPVWTESIKVTDRGSVGPSYVTLNTEDTSDYFCLNNLVNYAILIDRNDARKPMLVGIYSPLTPTSILLELSSAWTLDDNTLLYPARLMHLDSMNKPSITPSLEEVKVSLKDYVDGLTVDLFNNT